MTNKNLGQHIENTMKTLTTTISGIKDVSSAKAAVPTLNNAINNLDTYAQMVSKLPANQQQQVKQYIGQYIPLLQDALNKVGSIPGVSNVIQPTVQKLSEKLAQLQ